MDCLDILAQKGLVYKSKNHRCAEISYVVPYNVIQSIRKGVIPVPRHFHVDEPEELFKYMDEIFGNRIDGKTSYEYFRAELYSLLEDNVHLEFCRLITEYKMNDANNILFLYICRQLASGNENYNAIVNRLGESNMRTGFACLFSGPPGTGKTETAYQLAKITGRDIMPVDIAGSKSMWFGESEKIVKIDFSKPSLETRRSIWQSLMSALSPEDCGSLAGAFDLSGGQIENIVRKYTVETVLTGSAPLRRIFLLLFSALKDKRVFRYIHPDLKTKVKTFPPLTSCPIPLTIRK